MATRGDALTITHEVRHAGPGLVRNLELQEQPDTLGRTLFPVLPPDSTLQAVTRTYAAQRGVLRLEALLLRGGDPFGLFEISQRRSLPAEVVVRPRPRQLEGRLVLDELERTRLGREAADWEAVREWRPGDPVRRVHWPSTARRGFPVIRTAPRRRAEALVLALDLRPPGHRPADLRRFERAVALAAGVGLSGLERGFELRLWTLGDGGHWEGLRGRAGAASLLACLARVEPSPPGTPASEVPPGAVLVSVAPPAEPAQGPSPALVLTDVIARPRRRIA